MANTDSIQTDSGGNIASTTTSTGDSKVLTFPVELDNNFPDAGEILPSSFSVERTLEGPQILIEWGDIENTEAIGSITIVRRTQRYPNSVNDGEVVFSGNPESGFYNDLDAEPNKYYFYKLFSRRLIDNKYVSSDDHQGFDITYQSGYFNDFMYEELLPPSFRIDDHENAEKKNLFEPVDEYTDPDEHDIINHIEDGEFEPQLKRIMKTISRQFDQIKELIDQLSVITNIDKTGPKEVKEMAKLFSINLNTELSLEEQRNNIKRGVEKVKNKGTESGIEDDTVTSTGFPSKVVPGYEWLLTSNNDNSTSFDIDRVDQMNMGTPDNEANFSWGGLTGSIDYNSTIIFLFLNSSSPLTSKKIEQLNKNLQENALALNYEIFAVDSKTEIIEASDSSSDTTS
jgi:hypothetical protein